MPSKKRKRREYHTMSHTHYVEAKPLTTAELLERERESHAECRTQLEAARAKYEAALEIIRCITHPES